VGLHRQDELTRLIQTKLSKATRMTKSDVQPVTTLLAAQRLRARNARAARKATVVEAKRTGAA
jgi:hypothetical protein